MCVPAANILEGSLASGVTGSGCGNTGSPSGVSISYGLDVGSEAVRGSGLLTAGTAPNISTLSAAGLALQYGVSAATAALSGNLNVLGASHLGASTFTAAGNAGIAGSLTMAGGDLYFNAGAGNLWGSTLTYSNGQADFGAVLNANYQLNSLGQSTFGLTSKSTVTAAGIIQTPQVQVGGGGVYVATLTAANLALPYGLSATSAAFVGGAVSVSSTTGAGVVAGRFLGPMTSAQITTLSCSRGDVVVNITLGTVCTATGTVAAAGNAVFISSPSATQSIPCY